MTLDGSGNLGLGILTPSYKLHVNGNANIVGEYYKNGSVFIPDNAYNLSGSPNITVGTIRAGGTIASVNASAWDHLRLFHDGATAFFDAGGAESGIAFRIDNTAVGYPAASYTERMRITTAGNVGFNNDAPISITNATTLSLAKCGAGYVTSGRIIIAQDFNNGSVRKCMMGYDNSFNETFGDFGTANNSTGTWINHISIIYNAPASSIVVGSTGNVLMTYGYSSSDQKIKTKIKTIDNALWKVQQLRGVYYTHIIENVKSIGLIAQEVEHIIPEAVTENHNNNIKAIAYGNLVGLLIEAIKEQQEEINFIKNILKKNNLI
jgi:hypothetical protein